MRKKKTPIKKREIGKINFALLDQLSVYHKKTDLSIDEVTWNDLDLQKVFVNINNTTTATGEETLYHWLHNPLNDQAELSERASRIDHLSNDVDKLEQIRTTLNSIGYMRYDYRKMINSGIKGNSVFLKILSGLLILSYGSIIYSVVSLNTAYMLLITLVFMVNFVIHYMFSKKIASQMEVLTYVVGLLSKCRTLSQLTKESDPKLSAELEVLYSKLKPIYSKSSIIFKLEGVDLFADYFNIFFLLKERNYLKVAQYIEKSKEDVIRLYEVIGELDALISVIVYRKELDYYCKPYLDENNHSFEISEVYHPLIKRAISNNVQTTHSIVITGSNMSGKSTFLRTIGINTIFAQSIVTCLAKSYSSKFLHVLSSINLTDNITTNTSYFLMEAEAIKRMVEVVSSEVSSLILIDEIFSGTNPQERIAASIEILNLLGAGNTLTFVATHDLQIVSELNQFDCYYFAESVTDQGMTFEYKLNKGIVPTRNAIKILNYLKYPKGLLNKIEQRYKSVETL